MAGDTVITVIGNLTADPELRYTQNGIAVANFTIASTPRSFDRASGEWKDGEALFMRASVWREFAEHVASSLTKGSRVVASGRLRQRSYETKEGEKRTSIELDVDEIGPSLRYATARFNVNPLALNRRVPLIRLGAPPKLAALPKILGLTLQRRKLPPSRTHPSKTRSAFAHTTRKKTPWQENQAAIAASPVWRKAGSPRLP